MLRSLLRALSAATAEMEGVGHLQGGVLAAMLESAARLALGDETASTLALSMCFLRQAEPGELIVRVALPQRAQPRLLPIVERPCPLRVGVRCA